MKILMTGMMILFATAVISQDITPKINAALKTGDAITIKNLCMGSVDLAIPGYEDMYPADQVGKVLAKFFETNKPSNFEVQHQGTSKLDDLYRIGELTTSKGKYRVTFFIKNSGGKMQIKQLRIEPFDDDF